MTSITTSDIRAFIANRQGERIVTRQAHHEKGPDGVWLEVPAETRPVSSAEINRELTTLKRMFSLAIQAGKLLHKPHIPLLREDNVRKGFFETDQLNAVLRRLPGPLRPVVTFAYLTGWRIPSEVLTLEWRQVDFEAGEVRLDPGTTKNREGRVFPFTPELRSLLERQRQTVKELRQDRGLMVPWVFFRMVAKERGGAKYPEPIRALAKAWKNACIGAGCPGRIPHDLRRTAVRNLVRAGVSESVAMRLTGHKTRSVFERYNIVSDGDLRDAVQKLSAKVAGTIWGQSDRSSSSGDQRTDDSAQEILEAPPGFEPGMEVLQMSWALIADPSDLA